MVTLCIQCRHHRYQPMTGGRFASEAWDECLAHRFSFVTADYEPSYDTVECKHKNRDGKCEDYWEDLTK